MSTRFDAISGSTAAGEPQEEVPTPIVESIRRNHVCLKGTLFTPLSKTNTSTQSLNVQLRKQLDLSVNLVHGFSIPGIKTRFDKLDIVVIRLVEAAGVREVTKTCLLLYQCDKFFHECAPGM